jgi:hypothetical protein
MFLLGFAFDCKLNISLPNNYLVNLLVAYDFD